MTSVNPNTSANVNLALGFVGAVEIIVHYLAGAGIPAVPETVNAAVKSTFVWVDGLNSAFGVTPDWAANAGGVAVLFAGLNWFLHKVSSDVPGSLASVASQPPMTGSFEK